MIATSGGWGCGAGRTSLEDEIVAQGPTWRKGPPNGLEMSRPASQS